MKRKLFIFALLVIAISLCSYGVLAYFTAEDTAKNIITTGNIKMELNDKTSDNVDFPVEGIYCIVPGDTVDKIVSVKNVGNNPFYLRIKLDKSIETENSEITLNFDDITLDIDTTHWTLGTDGYYYYNSALEAGETTEPLFTSVNFSTDLGNEYMDATVNIDVHAEAVQSQNNSTNAMSASGWSGNNV